MCFAGREIPNFPPWLTSSARIGAALDSCWYQSCGQALAAESKIGIKKQTRGIDPEHVLIPDERR